MGYIDRVIQLGANNHYSLGEASGNTSAANQLKPDGSRDVVWQGHLPIAWQVPGAIPGDPPAGSGVQSGGVQLGTSGMRARTLSATWFQNSVASVNAWFKTTNSGSIMTICEMRTPDYWAMWVGSDNKLRGLVWTGGTTVDISGTGPVVNDGLWHMATFTWSDPGGNSGFTAGKLYLDGALIGTHTPTNNVASAFTGEFTIGAENDNTRTWVGSLDEISLFPLLLSATDISGLYREAARNAVIL